MANFVMLCLVLILVVATIQSKDISSQGFNKWTIALFENHYLNNEPHNASFQNWENEPNMKPGHTVHGIVVLYETMCPKSKELFTKHLAKVQNTLGDYIYVNTVAYGKATTTTHLNGSITFDCPHGELECYGNKLHECANSFYLGYGRNLDFNICLMEFGSNDDAVNKCGHIFNIDVPIISFIKSCAKDIMGSRLLQRAGEISTYIVSANQIPSNMPLPYLMITDKLWQGKYEDLIKDLCDLIDDAHPSVCDEQQ